MADEREDEKPEGEAPGEEAAESSQETAVGHKVVDAEAAADTGATEVFFSRDEPEPQPEPPQPAAAPFTEPSGTSPAAADREAADAQDSFRQKPELFVVGAFVGAFVLGKVLKKLTGSDD